MAIEARPSIYATFTAAVARWADRPFLHAPADAIDADAGIARGDRQVGASKGAAGRPAEFGIGKMLRAPRQPIALVDRTGGAVGRDDEAVVGAEAQARRKLHRAFDLDPLAARAVDIVPAYRNPRCPWAG